MRVILWLFLVAVIGLAGAGIQSWSRLKYGQTMVDRAVVQVTNTKDPIGAARNKAKEIMDKARDAVKDIEK